MTSLYTTDDLTQAALLTTIEELQAEPAQGDVELARDIRRRRNAAVKALHYWLAGVRPRPARAGAWTVPSATSANAVYWTTGDTCSCPAGEAGAPICWHRALVQALEMAEECAESEVGAIE